MTLERSLAEIVSHRMQAGEPLPVSLALAILRQVCDNLEYAHTMTDPASGQPLWISHRDVSPVYILVSEAGISRLVASGTPHGNPAYFAPEFVTNAVYDQRSDLFSLGAVAWEMLANRPLFHSPDPRETFAMIVNLAIPPPSAFNPRVPPDLDNIILMTLGRDPAYRWQSAAMLREGLRSVAERFGLTTIDAGEWVDLLAGRIVPQAPPPPAPPPPPPPLVRPPPSPVLLAPPDDLPPMPLLMPDPDPIPGGSEWSDDTNNETTVAPAYTGAAPAAPAAPAPAPPRVAPAPGPVIPVVPTAPSPAPTMIVSPAPAPPPVDDIVTFKSAPKPPEPKPAPVAALVEAAVAAPARTPIVRTPSEADFLATLEPSDAAPVAPPSDALFEDMDLPRPRKPATPVAPAPLAPSPNSGFELEIPEMTQIGAKPLITDGTEEMVALVGEKAAPVRVTRPSLPPPVAIAMPEVAVVAETSNKKKWILLGSAAALVIAAVVVVLFVVVL